MNDKLLNLYNRIYETLAIADYNDGNLMCPFCKNYTELTTSGGVDAGSIQHDDDCLWLEAKIAVTPKDDTLKVGNCIGKQFKYTGEFAWMEDFEDTVYTLTGIDSDNNIEVSWGVEPTKTSVTYKAADCTKYLVEGTWTLIN